LPQLSQGFSQVPSEGVNINGGAQIVDSRQGLRQQRRDSRPLGPAEHLRRQ